MMKKYKKIVYIVVAQISATTVFFTNSCTKKNDAPFTIKGVLLRDCDGNPLKNQKLHIEYYKKTTNGTESDKNVGSAISDSSGQFSIVCSSYKGTGEWTLVNEGAWSLRIPTSWDENRVVNLGNVYSTVTYYADVFITVSGVFSPSDTLFIGTADLNKTFTTDVKYIYPIENKTYQFSYKFETNSRSTAFSTIESQNLWWGLGKKEEESRLQANTFRMKYDICGKAKPENIFNINK